MLAIDLMAVGIDPETDSGVIDFQALRGTYISHLVSSGASVKTCQPLARHSSPVLTIGIYAKASLHDIAEAVESLPDLTPTQPHREALSATGTEGGPLPTATQSATPTIVDGTQSHKLQMVSAIHAEDLGAWFNNARFRVTLGIPARTLIGPALERVYASPWLPCRGFSSARTACTPIRAVFRCIARAAAYTPPTPPSILFGTNLAFRRFP